MVTKEALVKWMKLTQVPGIGPSKLMKLLNQQYTLDQIFSMSDSQLLQTGIFKETMLTEFDKLKSASEENFLKVINECEENGILITPLIDERYPAFLKKIPNPPVILFLKGKQKLLYEKKVAIVGSRQSDTHSKKWAYDLAQDFVKKGYVIVSGGAIGIDTSAHEGALISNGKTICVLASGFFKMFPSENSKLFKEIESNGLLISENLPNFPGSAIALIQRNRITSGISDAVIVVASGKKGGAMVQAETAFKQRIPIFCPDQSLGLLPNEGMQQIIKEWGGIEIKTASQVIKILEERKAEEESQTKLKLDSKRG